MGYVLYETIYPLCKKEKFREMTLLDYTRRYNREEYEKIRPTLKSRDDHLKAMANAKIVLPTAEEIKKNIGDTFAKVFNSQPPKPKTFYAPVTTDSSK